MNFLIDSRCILSAGSVFGILCALCLLSCATINEVKVAQGGIETIHDPLETRFERIALNRVPITDALLLLSQSINSNPQTKTKFVWYGPRSASIEEALKLKYPRVSLHAENVDLRLVLDRICKQANWSYRHGAKGFEFSEVRSRGAPN